MKTCETIKRLPKIIYAGILTHWPGFRELTPHEQILFLQEHGIKLPDVTDWGKPTPRQQDAIDNGPTHSIVDEHWDGKKPRQK